MNLQRNLETHPATESGEERIQEIVLPSPRQRASEPTSGFTVVSSKQQFGVDQALECSATDHSVELVSGSIWCSLSCQDTYLKNWQFCTREHHRGSDYYVACFGFPVLARSRNTILEALSQSRAPELSGRFTIVAVRENAVEIVTDRYAINPVYYSEGPRGVAVSSDARIAVLMAGNPLEFERDHVLELIITEGNLGFDEPLKFVNRLRGDELLRIEPRGKITRIPLRKSNREVPADIEWLVENLAGDLSFVAKHAHKIYCKLSGGYDSRLNFALLRHAGIPFECLTHHHPSADTKIAEQIGERYSVAHRFNQIPPEKNPIFVTGLGGDIGFYYRHSKKFDHPEQDLMRHFLPAKKLALCGSKADRRLLVDRAHEVFRRINEDDGYFALDIFYLNRLRTWAGRILAEPNNSSFCTFIDPKYYEFNRVYTAQQRAKRQVHLDLLEFCDPQLLKFPFFEFPRSRKGKVFEVLPIKAQTHVMRMIFAKTRTDVEVPIDTFLRTIFTDNELRKVLSVNESVKQSAMRFLAFERSVNECSVEALLYPNFDTRFGVYGSPARQRALAG